MYSHIEWLDLHPEYGEWICNSSVKVGSGQGEKLLRGSKLSVSAKKRTTPKMNCMGSSMGPQEDEGVLRGCTLLKISEISSWESLGRNRHCSGKNWDNVEKEGLESRNRWFQRKQNPALKERAYLWEANSQSIYALVPLTLRYLAHIFVCNNLKTKLSYVTEKQEICTGKFVDISDCLQVFFQLCCVFTFFKALR